MAFSEYMNFTIYTVHTGHTCRRWPLINDFFETVEKEQKITCKNTSGKCGHFLSRLVEKENRNPTLAKALEINCKVNKYLRMSETTLFRQVCSWLGPPLYFKYTQYSHTTFKILNCIKTTNLRQNYIHKSLKTVSDIQLNLSKNTNMFLKNNYIITNMKDMKNNQT